MAFKGNHLIILILMTSRYNLKKFKRALYSFNINNNKSRLKNLFNDTVYINDKYRVGEQNGNR